MRYLLLFCVLWFAVVPPLPAQDSGIDQGSELLIVPAGDKFLRWHGHPGRIYFLQASSAAEPLVRWSWFPYIEYGTGVEISHVVDGSPSRGFFRLQYTDAVPPPGVSLEDWDTDGDGLSNESEITTHQTNPLVLDTDGDGLRDGWEILFGTDPNDDGSVDPVNGYNGDKDGDGASNGAEHAAGTNADDAADFPIQLIYVQRDGSGTTTNAAGTANWSCGWTEGSASEALSAALEPDTLSDGLGSRYAFPDAPPPEPGFSTRSNLETANSNFIGRFSLSTNDGVTTGTGSLTQARVWIKAPESPISRTFHMLKVTRSVSWPLNPNGTVAGATSELISGVEVENLKIPAGGTEADETLSNPLDILPQVSAVSGSHERTVVSLVNVAIKPAENMAGVVGDMIPSVLTVNPELHFVSPKKTAEIAADYVILEATGVLPDQITSGPTQVVEWAGGDAVPNEPLKRRVKRDATGKTEVAIKILQQYGGEEVVKINVWIVWCDVTTTNGVAAFAVLPGGSNYYVSQAPNSGWKFIFKIQPPEIVDMTILERPKLGGQKQKVPPGGGNVYAVDPSLGSADSALDQWDLSRQFKITIRNPGTIPKADLQQGGVPVALLENQPVAVDTPVSFPLLDVEGNDDPPITDEDSNPYLVKSNDPRLNHQLGELSSADSSAWQVLAAWGTAGRAFAIEANFNEFSRVELWDEKRTSGQFWFRISDHVKWHHYLDATFNVASSQWHDTASSSGLGHPKP